MQGYVAVQDGAFAESRKCFGELEGWMASEEAAGLQHAELEEQLDVRGRELLRRLFQDRLDLTAAREKRRHDVTGEDSVVRTRAENGRARPLVTNFGQVSVSRIAYRSPGRSNVHPLDAALNLPEEKHSHGLRKMAAIESARLDGGGKCRDHPRDWRDDRKRQAEELGRRCAADVEAFYLQRVTGPAPQGCPLILTFDGKGIVMLPEALRPAAEAASRGVTVTIVIDFIHVLLYAWKAAWSFFGKGEPAAEEWVADQARKILGGKSAQVAAGIRRRATTYGYSPDERAGADECARYLDNKKDYLGYATALRQGWTATPIIISASYVPMVGVISELVITGHPRKDSGLR